MRGASRPQSRIGLLIATTHHPKLLPTHRKLERATKVIFDRFDHGEHRRLARRSCRLLFITNALEQLLCFDKCGVVRIIASKGSASKTHGIATRRTSRCQSRISNEKSNELVETPLTSVLGSIVERTVSRNPAGKQLPSKDEK
jgi:hypothetical protein